MADNALLSTKQQVHGDLLFLLKDLRFTAVQSSLRSLTTSLMTHATLSNMSYALGAMKCLFS